MMGTILKPSITTVKAIEKPDVSAAPPAKEHIKRTLLKTISWRLVGTLATVIISYAITGTLVLAFSIGVVELVSKMLLYFFHERAWNSIKWGK